MADMEQASLDKGGLTPGSGHPVCTVRSVFAKPDPVTERVMDFQHLAPALLDNVGTSVPVLPGQQFIAKQLDIMHGHKYRGPGARITVMFRKVDAQAVADYPQIERQASLEAVLELDVKAQETKVKLPCLGFVEHAQQGDGAFERYRWRGSLRVQQR